MNDLIEKCQDAYKREFLSGGTTESTYGAMIKTVLEEMRSSIKTIPATAPHDVMIEWLSKHDLVNKFASSNNITLGEDK